MFTHGSRTPAFFMKGKKMAIAFNTDTNFNDVIKRQMMINRKTNLMMEQVVMADGRLELRIFVDGIKENEVQHNWTTPFKNVKCFLGNPWHEGAHAIVSNLRYVQIEP